MMLLLQSSLLIIFYYKLYQMQMGFQTDRKIQRIKSNNSAANVLTNIKQNPLEQQSQKQRYIKILTIKNRELFETLKNQNENLAKRIQRQKSRNKSYIKQPLKTKEYQGIKKQLNHAYKLIDTYKMNLSNLKARTISHEGYQKLYQLQSKIKIEDTKIEQLNQELKMLKIICTKQTDQIKNLENQDIKNMIKELQKEADQLKQKLNNYRRAMAKRQLVQKKQQAYQVELQQKIREFDTNQKELKKKEKQQRKVKNSQNLIDMDKITSEEWQKMKNQVLQQRSKYAQYVKKVDTLTRNKIKQVKSTEQNQLKVKQKQKTIKILRNKLHQLRKIVGYKSKKIENSTVTITQSQQNDFKIEVSQHLPPIQKKTPPSQEVQIKKWMLPQKQIQWNGKIFPNSIFFTDKKKTESFMKTKVVKIQIFTNFEKSPCLLRFYYMNENQELIQGVFPDVQLKGLDIQANYFELENGDDLDRIEGINHKNNIFYLQLFSRYGKKASYGNKPAQGERFILGGNNNQRPCCFFGAYLPNKELGFSICHLGCQIAKYW